LLINKHNRFVSLILSSVLNLLYSYFILFNIRDAFGAKFPVIDSIQSYFNASFICNTSSQPESIPYNSHPGNSIYWGYVITHTRILPNTTLPTHANKPRTGATVLPVTNLTLKHVTIGTGVQNYSCSSDGNSKPSAIGALATLYDATTLAYTSISTLHEITATAVTQSLNSALILNNPLSIPNIGSFPIIGFHYFTADGTPTFDLTMVREILFSKKVGDVPAPGNSSKGPAGTGSVDWLALTDNGKGTSVGLGGVYRVVTAGGNPPSQCGQYVNKVFSIQYSAEYWFYG
jgi:hypothetical protein